MFSLASTGRNNVNKFSAWTARTKKNDHISTTSLADVGWRYRVRKVRIRSIPINQSINQLSMFFYNPPPGSCCRTG